MHASAGMLGRRAVAGGAPRCPPSGSVLRHRPYPPPPPVTRTTAAAAASAVAAAARRRRRPSVSAAAAEPKQQEQQPSAPETPGPAASTPAPPTTKSAAPPTYPDLGGLAGGHAALGPAPQIASPRREATAAAADYAAVYDRLIALFEARPREDWKKLVVFSAQWPQHRQGVFERLKSRADAEADVDARVALRRLYRTLQGVDAEVGRYNGCLQRFLDADEHEWEAVVAQYRGDLQRAFFEHLQCLIVAAAREEQVQEGASGGAEGGGDAVKAAAEAVKAAAERAKKQQEAEAAAAVGAGKPGKGFGAKSAADAVRASAKEAKDAAAAAAAAAASPSASSGALRSPARPPGTATTDPSTRKERLIAVNARLLALVANHDSVAADTDGLERAAEAYRDVLSSARSVEDVDRAVEKLAASGRIDPAFLQISARAYGAARDTEMTLDEAKWVSYRMYVKARDHFDRQQPQEKRILEYLVTLRDRAERSRLLDQAVTPGPTRGTDSHDYLYSTPSRLYKVLDGTLRAWEEMQQAAQGKMGVSEKSSTPRRVVAMRELRDEIRRRYL